MNNKKCVICGFDYSVESHHIIKRKDCGSDEEANLVHLCPNHHWIADFGTEDQRVEVLSLITKITGKVGKEIDNEEKKSLERKIRILEEDRLCWIVGGKFIPYTNEEWEKHKETWNYMTTQKWLLGRGVTKNQCADLHKRAEILLLIEVLKRELKTLDF